jgi:hypothetical protein
MNIPITFRPPARAMAARRLAGITDDEKRQKIINEISEEEWKLDRVEWRNWMDMMRGKFARIHTTPQERVKITLATYRKKP